MSQNTRGCVLASKASLRRQLAPVLCRAQSPGAAIKLTDMREITPNVWCIRTRKARPRSARPRIVARRCSNTAMVYRSALDIATKSMRSSSCHARLVWLHDNHAITPDFRSWADYARIVNAALHDPDGDDNKCVAYDQQGWRRASRASRVPYTT